MPQPVSPRGTFQKIADVLKAQIEANSEMAELPSIAEVMSDHSVSRGVALRAFGVLREVGAAEPVPGGRWRVIRDGQRTDRRPLAERLVEVIADDKLKVGATFPSASALCERFDVSRPTVTKALEKLEAAGWLSEGGQGKLRTVRALPSREERSSL
ncbi:GntR family transcriptional regulator [Streptomyces sp. WI04-05B]|uniref:GntR family transcriptional regulator n=1 Tax=Streptomyces TaxID=1883 RepID=UPI0029BF039D|nr:MULTISPECIES: GntR family transcriptional regulator [unclassified Streptomyces]MDX2541967.1 GntR family transcriptional regulator [Streptomyces sp. WI04-05B]MDX2587049.1 GntR family transcriptional regulator [Streptomyces sp. WI04-05A]